MMLMSLMMLAITRVILWVAHECLDSMHGQVEGNRMVAD